MKYFSTHPLFHNDPNYIFFGLTSFTYRIILEASNIFGKTMALTNNQEDYLEAIYQIILKQNGVRVKDIAKQMEVKNSSVTAALRILEREEYINYEPYGVISLTALGNQVARRLNERHRLFTIFFTNFLGISHEKADRNACAIEHTMDQDVFTLMSQFIKFLHNSKQNGSDWMERFKEFSKQEEVDLDCQVCMDDYVEEVDNLLEMEGKWD